MGPLLEIWIDGEAVITLLSKCLNATASIVYFSVSCKLLADRSFSFPIKFTMRVCNNMHVPKCEGVCAYFLHIIPDMMQSNVNTLLLFANKFL